MKPDQAGPPAIRIASLTKDYALALRGLRVRAVENLSLEIADGSVFGLLGPNGSGKSTTIKAILGLLEPTSGSCEVFGVPSTEVGSRLDVGYLPEAPFFHGFLTGRELVAFCARLCGVARKGLEQRVTEVIDWVGMSAAADRRVGTYSKGMLQRIGLAQAIVHDPRLLILDEPTAGVDPVGSAEMGTMIQDLGRRGKTVVVSSHLLAQIEGVCDRIAILNRGRLVLEGAVDDLVEDRSRVALIVENLPKDAEPELKAWLERRGARLTGVEQPRASLDRVFLDHVAGPARDATSGDGKPPSGREDSAP